MDVLSYATAQDAQKRAKVAVQAGNRLAAIGDSTVIGTGNSGPFPDIDRGDGRRAPTSTTNAGVIQRGDTTLHHACLASGGRLRYAFNAGVAGDTTTMMLARWDTDITPYAADFDLLFINGGINDAGVGGVSYATSMANIDAMVQRTRALGKQPILAKILPSISGTTAGSRQLAIGKLNLGITRYAAQNKIPVVDFFSSMVTPSTGALSATYDSGDLTHPNAAGYQALGVILEAALRDVAHPGLVMVPADATDTSNLLTGGGLFLTDTNADGIADSWSNYSGAIGASYTPSIVTGDTAVVGSKQRITLTSAATNFWGVVQQVTIASGKIAVGDKLLLTGRMTNSGPLTQAQMRINFTGSTATTTSLVAGTSRAVTGGIEALEFVVPPGTTAVQVGLLARSGTGFVEFSQIGLYNLTKLAVA